VSAVYIALPVALLLAVAGVVAFIWAARSGQLDDLETPGQRVLFDDDVSPTAQESNGDSDPESEGADPSPEP
jgi:cbb3-type cytochrome oxidase maturation protein